MGLVLQRVVSGWVLLIMGWLMAGFGLVSGRMGGKSVQPAGNPAENDE